MALDTSIYFKNQQADPAASLERGVRLGNLIQGGLQKRQDREKQNLVNQAYQSGITRNEDGSFGFDKNKTLAQLRGIGGQEFMQGKTMFDQQDQADLKRKMEQLDISAQLIGSATDQNSWTAGKQKAKGLGLDVSQVPDFYDPNFKNTLLNQTLSGKEQLANQLRKLEIETNAANAAATRAQAYAIAGMGDKTDRYKAELENQRKTEEAAAKKAKEELTGENLPIDQKKIVETLSAKNANKTSIKNQIDAVLSGWDQMSDDQKIAQGGQLLKTLNSPEGADAIGAEEAKRLGSKLQFAYGNLFDRSNPIQFGRDLDGFKEQARLTAESIGKGVKANQDEIDTIFKRKPQSQQASKSPKTNLKKFSDSDLDKLSDAELDLLLRETAGGQ